MTESHHPKNHWFVKYVLPLFIVVGVVGLVALAVVLKQEPERKESTVILPTVEYLIAKAEPITLMVESQGIVEPKTETLLIAEVSGRIESISDKFFAGGYFKKGDPLVEIESVDYRAQLAAAKSQLAEAKLALAQESALADQALEDWKSLREGVATDLALRKPQLERAQATLEAAQVRVELAQRDLDRTIVRAPYDGRIRQKLADIGQMVAARQTQLARIYSTDTAEIRLPIALNDIQYVNLPEVYRDRPNAVGIHRPKVWVSANYGDTTYTWEGVIDRSEGAIDSKTRLSYVVAQVQDPYAKGAKGDRPPLKVGLFAEATIEGNRLENAFSIPRKALHDNETIYLIDAENRIQFQTVDVYKLDTETAIITSGLKDGDRVCLTPLEYAVIGMEVEPTGVNNLASDARVNAN